MEYDIYTTDIADKKMGYSESQMEIFLTALHLFAVHGYDNIAVGTIAKTAKVKISALYGLGGKQGLLSACYKYFRVHRHDTRLTPDQYEEILRYGSKEEVLRCLLYVFPASIVNNMFECLSIINARLHIDDEARALYADDIDRSMEYLNEYFRRGIEIGRFEEFDTDTISMMLISFRLFALQLAIIKSERLEKWHEIETNAFEEIKKSLPFKY